MTRSIDRRSFLMTALSGALMGQSAVAGSPGKLSERAAALIGQSSQPLRCLAPNGSEPNLAPVIAEWEAATGGKVIVETADVDAINDRMTLDYLGRRQNYDIALPATFGVPEMAWADVVQPLDPFVQQFGCNKDDFTTLFDLGNSINDTLYGFQTDGDVYLMFYRKDWMENADIAARYADTTGEALRIPQSWAELDRQMAFFHAPDEGRFGGALFRTPGYLVWEFVSRLYGAGVLPFAADMTPGIDRPEAVGVLEDMLRATEFQHPATGHAGLFENWTLYAASDIYCNIGWGGSQKYFNQPGSPIREKLTYSALPGGRRGPAAYFNWGWSYVVPTQSARPDLAFLFCAFAVTPDISTKAVRERAGFFDPFHEVHYDDPVIRDVYSPAFLDVHRAAMRKPLPDLYIPGYRLYVSALSDWLDRARAGRETPERALHQASLRWQLITKEFGQRSQSALWQEVLARYPV